MEKRRLGKTDMLVSALGLGGAEIGFEKVDDVVVDRLIGVAADAGGNVIDTAAFYKDKKKKSGTQSEIDGIGSSFLLSVDFPHRAGRRHAAYILIYDIKSPQSQMD